MLTAGELRTGSHLDWPYWTHFSGGPLRPSRSRVWRGD